MTSKAIMGHYSILNIIVVLIKQIRGCWLEPLFLPSMDL